MKEEKVFNFSSFQTDIIIFTKIFSSCKERKEGSFFIIIHLILLARFIQNLGNLSEQPDNYKAVRLEPNQSYAHTNICRTNKRVHRRGSSFSYTHALTFTVSTYVCLFSAPLFVSINIEIYWNFPIYSRVGGKKVDLPLGAP